MNSHAAKAVTRINSIGEVETVHLTKMEISILSLVPEGLTASEIGDKLYISKRTVEFHLLNIGKKLEVKKSIRAYAEAKKLGLID